MFPDTLSGWFTGRWLPVGLGGSPKRSGSPPSRRPSAYTAWRRSNARSTAWTTPTALATYDKHELSDEEWVVVPQIALLLEPFNKATIVLQGSNYVTGSLVLPTISSLHKVTSPGEDMLDDVTCVMRMHPSISAGRLTLHEDIQRRFMENMYVSKVEDFALATVLDPRFKWLDFSHLDQWLDGTLTKEMVLA
jgi:hypothetical protein